MRGKTRKIYVGMDVSINGMSICTYEINNGIIDRIVFDYWHKDVVRLGNVEYFNIEINRHEPISGRDKEENIIKKVIECLKTKSISTEHSMLCIEKSIMDRKDINSNHNQFVYKLKQECEALHLFDVVDVDNHLIKKVWFRSNISRCDNGLYSELFENIKITKSSIRKKIKYNATIVKTATKTMMYVAWLKNGFPHFQNENSLNFSINTNEVDLNGASNISSHPISDIVDSCAIAMYMYLLDSYGPKLEHPN
jgi:hypothetical protein